MAKRKSGKTGPIQPDLEKIEQRLERVEAERAFGAMLGWKDCRRCTRPVDPFLIKWSHEEPAIIQDQVCPSCMLNDLEIKISSVSGQQLYMRSIVPQWKRVTRQLKKIIRDRAKRT